MSESPNDSSASEPSSDQKTSGGSRKAFYCVLGVIGLIAAAICYDLYVAAPAVQAAFDRVAAASLKSMIAEEPLTNLQIREVVGKEPSETFEDDEGHVEVYHWIGSVMGQSHKLHTVYRKEGDGFTFIRHFKSADQVAKGQTVVDVDPAESNFDDDEYGGGGGAATASGTDAPQSNGDGGEKKSDRPEMEDEDETAGESDQ